MTNRDDPATMQRDRTPATPAPQRLLALHRPGPRRLRHDCIWGLRAVVGHAPRPRARAGRSGCAGLTQRVETDASALIRCQRLNAQGK